MRKRDFKTYIRELKAHKRLKLCLQKAGHKYISTDKIMSDIYENIKKYELQVLLGKPIKYK